MLLHVALFEMLHKLYVKCQMLSAAVHALVLHPHCCYLPCTLHLDVVPQVPATCMCLAGIMLVVLNTVWLAPWHLPQVATTCGCVAPYPHAAVRSASAA